jgi:hypothetical protein
MQANQINRVVNTWAQTDPAAATAAVQSADITDQQRTSLLNNIQMMAARKANQSR